MDDELADRVLSPVRHETEGRGEQVVPIDLKRDPMPAGRHFVRDLRAESRETVYAAARALGFLPELKRASAGELRRTAEGHPDALARLESAAALARLGERDGWAAIERALLSAPDAPLRMEAVLILGELKTGEALRLLARIALLAMLGRTRCERYLGGHAPEVLRELEFFWIRRNENWTNRLDVADQIDIQIAQWLD